MHKQNTQYRRRNNAKPKKRRVLKVLLGLVLACIIVVGSGFTYLYIQLSRMYDSDTSIISIEDGKLQLNPLPSLGAETEAEADADAPEEALTGGGKNTSIIRKSAIDKNVENILLLGIDQYDGREGRSDVMMIVSINYNTGKISLVSILRDTLVPIPGHDYNRLNTAVYFGGPGMTINLINELFDLDIQYYFRSDFTGVEKIIDTLGGVNIALTKAEYAHLQAQDLPAKSTTQTQRLDGQTALAYARIRKLDSDFARTQRQRNVMDALFSEAKTMNPVEAVKSLNAILPYAKTNMNAATMTGIATKVLLAKMDMQQMHVPVDGAYKNKTYKKMSILELDFDANKQAIHQMIYGQ